MNDRLPRRPLWPVILMAALLAMVWIVAHRTFLRQ
jgi:hypothetical protein